MNHIFKISTFLLLAGLFLGTACGEEEKKANQFTIEGEIKGLTSNLYFRHPDKVYTRETPPDSIIVENGKFKYADTLSSLSLIRAYTDFSDKNSKLFKRPADGKGFFPVKSMYLMFFAYPGANIKVEGEATDFMNAYPSGDEYNNSLAAINKIAFPNFNESVNLAVEATYKEDSIEINQLNALADSISTIGTKARIKHIKENPNSLGALWYLDDMMKRRQIEDSSAIEIFNAVSKDLSDLAFYKTVEARVNGIEATKEGMPVPKIKTMATLDSKEFDITSYQGKYILIDFWGTWCGPCIKEMPEVKAFQEKYKDKLYVLGINSGDTKEKTQQFVEENGYDWQQLLSDRANTPDNFVNRFNVQGFPTKFIIDPDGKIIKRYLGTGEEAFELLEELMK